MQYKNNSKGRFSIGDIEFSGSTYQVQVLDPLEPEGFWVFLQLDKKGGVKDAFCSCEIGEKCEHIQEASLFLFQDGNESLHDRYARSLWRHLCLLCGERSGCGTDNLRSAEKGIYEWRSQSGKLVFQARGKTDSGRKFLSDTIEQREEETEETSLKFSNLSVEELEAWRKGKPSSHLQFELSFWNDLAQWMMLRQVKGEPYKIHFQYSIRGVPNWVECDFTDLSAGFSVPEAHLAGLIPSLASVESPLKIHGLQDASVSSIQYDQVQGILYIYSEDKGKAPENESEELKRKGIDLGNWIFVPDDGFYAKKQLSFFGDAALQGGDIVWALEEHRSTLRERLRNGGLHEVPVKMMYTITFDGDWNLHVVGYLNEPGDLSRPYSHFWGSWAYLQDDGFYKLEDVQFPRVETVVLSRDVSDFVLKNRTWFNTQQGFFTHLKSAESYLSYHVDPEKGLWIGSAFKENGDVHDFGHWIYIVGQGFYQKGQAQTEVSLPVGSYIEPDAVPGLIRNFRDELEAVPHFFLKESPVRKVNLEIKVDAGGSILAETTFEYFSGYEKASFQVFDEYLYTKGMGFSLLPLPAGFPRRYTRSRIIPESEEADFIQQEMVLLEKFAVKVDMRLQTPSYLRLLLEHMEKDEQSGPGQYICKLAYATDLGAVDAVDVWKALQGKSAYFFSAAGAILLDRENLKWLKALSKKHVDLKRKAFKLGTVDFLRLNAFDMINIPEQENVSASELFQELIEFRTPSEPDISELKSTLWHYQAIGVRWLWFLYQHGLSGLLCDDMGLGKTHQTMALFAAARSKMERPCHMLVICPTSVIYHWQDKLQTFLPKIRVCTFYGSERSLEGFQHEYDLLLTSYGIWRRESAMLKKNAFEIAVFDEVQLAKNGKSKLHASLRDVQARTRLGLTGTPIENELAELKALFDLVLPGYMPSEQEFKEYFQKPIEKQQDQEKRTILSKYVRPFIMRRKKNDVLTELPEKIEEISYCPLLPEQTELYRKTLESAKKQILELIEQKKESVPYLHVFALLSRLKQICDHPAVFYKEPEKYAEYSSGKWELFLELLHEARDSGQKVVVFSQYLAQLDIIELYLKKQGIGFAAIRGQTVRRNEEMRRFQEDASCEVFVASLQAAGLGIDLTSASVVIHYDRWWNAARENQATDRVHRIGQTRGVQVFKLVTRGTFEEKIHDMIERKGRLMEDIIGVDDQQIIKTFNREEIIELLQDVHLGSDDQRDVITDGDG